MKNVVKMETYLAILHAQIGLMRRCVCAGGGGGGAGGERLWGSYIFFYFSLPSYRGYLLKEKNLLL